MKKNVKVIEKEKEPTGQQCHHFWVIDVANGRSSLGKCKYCGEKKEFMNAFPTFNPLRKNSNPLNFPKMPDVEMEKESES
jgi:hypothetical protein